MAGFCQETLYRICLFFGHVANIREPEDLALERLKDENNPQDEPGEAENDPCQDDYKRPEQRDKKKNCGSNFQYRAHDDPRHCQEYRLKTVEPDKAVSLIRLKEEKDDRRQEHIRQSGDYLVRSSNRHCQSTVNAITALGTEDRIIGHLRSAKRTWDRHCSGHS